MAELNENKYYTNFDPETTQPWWLANEITPDECANLQNGKGTAGVEEDQNCEVLQNELIPAILQEYTAIQNGDIVLAANEDSKCSNGSPLPTIASILSRLLRYCQAVACILCTYDPVLIKILKQGEYPQILMGQTGSKYPAWRNPSEVPTAGSKLPITSGGVWEAIQQAINSVFHEATDDRKWVENGGVLSYDFYAEKPADLKDICEGWWDGVPKEDESDVVGPVNISIVMSEFSGDMTTNSGSVSGDGFTDDYRTSDNLYYMFVPKNRSGWDFGCNGCGMGGDYEFTQDDPRMASLFNLDVWLQVPREHQSNGQFVNARCMGSSCSKNLAFNCKDAEWLAEQEFDLLIGLFHAGDEMDFENRHKGTTYAIYKLPWGKIAGSVKLTLDPSLDNFNMDNPQFPELRQLSDGTWTNIPAVAAEPEPCPAEGDTCLVKKGANGTNQVYAYENGNWVPMDVIGEPNDYAVIHINKGAFMGNELYWLNVGGVQTWNQMDVSDQNLRQRISALEAIYARAVLPAVSHEQYEFAVRDTLAQAQAVPATSGKTSVVLVIGAP